MFDSVSRNAQTVSNYLARNLRIRFFLTSKTRQQPSHKRLFEYDDLVVVTKRVRAKSLSEMD